MLASDPYPPPGQSRRVFLLGIDGLPQPTFDRFVAEGRLPHFARLLERAIRVTLIPTLPPLTCPCWLSIASGANPESLGVSNLLLPGPGEAPDVVVNGFDRSRVKGEFLWEAMDRQGLPAIVLKYPGSWPPRSGSFVQVDGAGGYADITCRFDAARSTAYLAGIASLNPPASQPAHFPAGYEGYWRTHAGSKEGVVEVTLRDPKGWRNLPADSEPAWEFVVTIEQVGRRTREVIHGLALRAGGRTGVLLSRTKNATGALWLAHDAPWSDWLYSGDLDFAFRFKLLACDLDRRRLWLYRTAAHRLSGFTRPPEVASALQRDLGPVSEWAGAYDLLNGLVDFDTQLEIYRQHTDWLIGAIRHLDREHTWSGFFTQWHVIEYAHHLVGASLAPDHPLHPRETAERDLEWLARVYALADELLGAVESVVGDNTMLVVAGDHGHDLVHTAFFINHFLQRHGWLATVERDGRTAVDWSRSAAYGLFPGIIRLNLAERWSGGRLSPDEGARVAAAITQSLRALRDPRTGEHPVKLVLDRDDLHAFGQGGEAAPDLFFCLDRGYETATRIQRGLAGEADFELTIPYREVTSGHGSFFPPSASARTMALFAGPGIGPKSLVRPVLAAVDLAPTMAAFLGIDPPSPQDGRSALAREFADLPVAAHSQ